MKEGEENIGAELMKSFSSEDFVLNTQRQIAKDFGNYGFDFETDFENVAFDMPRLNDAMQNMLSEIAEKHSGKWLQLMYSLDIPEKKYVQFFENASADWLIEFADIIIRREAQKVFFREKFR